MRISTLIAFLDGIVRENLSGTHPSAPGNFQPNNVRFLADASLGPLLGEATQRQIERAADGPQALALLLMALLGWRFLRTGGLQMLRMMERPAQPGASHDHHAPHGHH